MSRGTILYHCSSASFIIIDRRSISELSQVKLAKAILEWYLLVKKKKKKKTLKGFKAGGLIKIRNIFLAFHLSSLRDRVMQNKKHNWNDLLRFLLSQFQFQFQSANWIGWTGRLTKQFGEKLKRQPIGFLANNNMQATTRCRYCCAKYITYLRVLIYIEQAWTWISVEKA